MSAGTGGAAKYQWIEEIGGRNGSGKGGVRNSATTAAVAGCAPCSNAPTIEAFTKNGVASRQRSAHPMSMGQLPFGSFRLGPFISMSQSDMDIVSPPVCTPDKPYLAHDGATGKTKQQISSSWIMRRNIQAC